MGRYEFSLNANIKAKDGICPRYGCEGRNAGCHSKCEIFTIWNQKHLKNKKEMQKKAFIENQADYRKNEYFRRKRDKQK